MTELVLCQNEVHIGDATRVFGLSYEYMFMKNDKSWKLVAKLG